MNSWYISFPLKRKKNIFDFNDVEHMALEILRNKESKEHEKRPVALELCNHFKEVMVDEYQDSNELQEQILTAVSSDNNYFTEFRNNSVNITANKHTEKA